MLDANKIITHVFKEYDSATRQNRFRTEQLVGSWFAEAQSSISNGIITANDLIKVRIPFDESPPIIKKGDYLFLGEVELDSNTSIGELRKRFPDSFEVQSLTVNRNSATGYSNHVRVFGS